MISLNPSSVAPGCSVYVHSKDSVCTQHRSETKNGHRSVADLKTPCNGSTPINCGKHDIEKIVRALEEVDASEVFARPTWSRIIGGCYNGVGTPGNV